MKKIIANILIIVNMIKAIVLTILLLSYNEFRVTEIGGNT